MAMQRQINIVIKTIGADTARKQIQDIVPDNLTGKLEKYSQKLKKSGEAATEAATRTASFKKEIRSMTGNVLASLGAIALLQRGFSALSNVFTKGGDLERTQDQFGNIVGNMQKLLPGLRDVTRGTVEDMTLLQTANRAVIEGMKSSDLQKVFRMGTVASRKLGLDTADTLGTITKAITRHDESALSTLGTILKLNPQMALQLSMISKQTGLMSPVVAMQYRQAKIMELLNKQFGSGNDLLEDTKEVGDRARTAFSNFSTTLQQALAKALVPLSKVLTTTLQVATNFIEKIIIGNSSIAKFVSFMVTTTTIAIGLTAALKATAIAAMMLKGVFTGGWFLVLAKFAAIIGGAALIAGMLTMTNSAESLSEKLQKVGQGFRYLFDLVMNYSNESGMSKVLAQDEAAMGNLTGALKAIARTLIVVKTVAVEFFEGFIFGMSRALGASNSFVQVLSAIFGTSTMTKEGLYEIGQTAAVIGIKFGEIAGKITSTISSIERFVKFLERAAKFAGIIALTIGAITLGGPAIAALLGGGGLIGAQLGLGVGAAALTSKVGVASLLSGSAMLGVGGAAAAGALENSQEPSQAIMPQNTMMNTEDESAIQQRKMNKSLEEILNQNQLQTRFEEEKKTDRDVNKATRAN